MRPMRCPFCDCDACRAVCGARHEGRWTRTDYRPSETPRDHVLTSRPSQPHDRARAPSRSRLIMEGSAQHLRVLIANERQDRLAVVAPLVSSLGHEGIAREREADEVGDLTKRIQPDVA